jgi:uncharacterized protein (DUF433 family)
VCLVGFRLAGGFSGLGFAAYRLVERFAVSPSGRGGGRRVRVYQGGFVFASAFVGWGSVMFMPQWDRISLQPGQMGGRACIRGMRVTVGMIVNQMASGQSIDNLLIDYPYLERDDVAQALRYAAFVAAKSTDSSKFTLH